LIPRFHELAALMPLEHGGGVDAYRIAQITKEEHCPSFLKQNGMPESQRNQRRDEITMGVWRNAGFGV